MEMILSPNAPDLLFSGAFDGFPTGCCAEAGLCGVAVLCSDLLEQNVAFKDGQEIVIVPRDARAICERVSAFHEQPDALFELAERGQATMSQVLGLGNQMAPRLRVLSQCLHGAEGRIEEAERLVAAGQTEAAKELLVALSETYPTGGRVWNRLGVVLWQQGAAPNAVRAFLQALEIDPTDRTTILNCANVFQAFGQTSDARLLLRGHLARHPNDAEARALCEAA